MIRQSREETRAFIERLVYKGPTRLLRLSDLKLLSRGELVEDLYFKFLTIDISRPWDSGPSGIERMAAYAILSHRWSKTELLYDDAKELYSSPHHLLLTGERYAKVLKFREKALEFGCHYAWFDSGCIDQTSSAELDESIRAMFTWYRDAKICIVHLGGTIDPARLGEDEWFCRGWTLQELLAPNRMKFYDATWQAISSLQYDINRMPLRHESSADPQLLNEVARTTGIPSHFLLHQYQPSVQVARKITPWMAHRRTTRMEDRVYCLVGLLNVHLQVAYGEGFDRAFFRLQVEIMQTCDNRSLFIWNGHSSPLNSMLACDPSAFIDPNRTQVEEATADCLFRPDDDSIDQSLSMTNCGLRLQASLYTVRSLNADLLYNSAYIVLRVERFGDIFVPAGTPILYDAEAENLVIAVLGSCTLQQDENDVAPNDLGIEDSMNDDEVTFDTDHDIGTLNTAATNYLYAIILRKDTSRLPYRYSRIPIGCHIWLPYSESLRKPQTIYVV